LTLKETGAVLAPTIQLANNPWTRLKGLLGTKSLLDGEGLWIIPCNSIHMFGMRYAIDAVFISKDLRVVRVAADLQPGKAVWPVKGAWSVIELPSGFAARHGVESGCELVLAPAV